MAFPFCILSLETAGLVFTTENPSPQPPRTLKRPAWRRLCILFDSTDATPRSKKSFREAALEEGINHATPDPIGYSGSYLHCFCP
jgi:hypothetical protein